MAAPTYSWNTINITQTDADSPLDTTLMEALRQNLIHLEEWLGDGYIAAKDHDHDGVNSKTVVLADDSVAATKLARTDELSLFTDFLGDVLPSEWAVFSGATIAVVGSVDNGIISVTGGTGAAGVGQVQLPFRLASGVTITHETKVKMDATPSTKRPFSGLADASGASYLNHINFDRNTGTSKILVRTETSGVATSTDLDLDVSTSVFQRLTLVATTTQVDFYVDGVLKASHTTNIPTVNMGAVAGNPSGTGKAYYDYVFVHQDGRN